VDAGIPFRPAATTTETVPMPPQHAASIPVTRELTWFERRRVKLIWLLVVMTSLPWGSSNRTVPIPKRVEQLSTALALGGAALLALALNRRVRIRAAGFVVLYGALVVVSLVPVLGGWAGPGSLFRAGRFGLVLAVAVLLSPFWARDRDVLLDAQLGAYRFLVVVTGIWLLLGLGFNEQGRLFSQVPALEPPQVGQVAAVLAGVLVLLMVCNVVPVRRGLPWFVACVAFLLLSYTRTAVVALVVAVLLGMLSLVSTSRRARALVTLVLLGLPLGVLVFGSLADAWFRRGQDEALFSTLTGRTLAWDRIYEFPRDVRVGLFGIGLGDKSIDGLPIDSGVLAIYHEQGRVGVAVMVAMLIALVGVTVAASPGPRRAIALFLITYCIVSSYTETGIGDVSGYLLILVVASSLVWGRSSRPQGRMNVRV
jgi:hypothetical protein